MYISVEVSKLYYVMNNNRQTEIAKQNGLLF